MRLTLLFMVLGLLFSCNITEEEIINSSYRGKVKEKDPLEGKEFPKDGIGTQWENFVEVPSLKLLNAEKYPQDIKIYDESADKVYDNNKPDHVHRKLHGHSDIVCHVDKITDAPSDKKVSYTLHHIVPRHADRSFIQPPSATEMPHDLGYIAPVVLRSSAKEYIMWYTKVQKIYDTSPGQNNFLQNFHYSYKVECKKSIDGGQKWNPETTFRNGFKRLEGILKGGIIVFDVIEDNGSYLLWYLGKTVPSDKDVGWRLYSATWSHSQNIWIVDVGSTPFLLKDIEAVGFDTHSISKGSGFYDPVDGVYKLWYGGSNGVNERVGLAFSSNGEVSAVKEREPAIFSGRTNKFDSEAVTDPYIMKEGDLYRMWYSGYDGKNWSIGLAYSWDGVKFTYSNDSYSPVIADPAITDKADYRFPCVIKEGDKYKMWYSKREYGTDIWKIEMATSSLPK